MNTPRHHARHVVLLSLISLAMPSSVFAWGMGHNSQADQIWRLLPKSFTGRFTPQQKQDFIRHYSHYPDTCHSGNTPPPEPAGKYCLETAHRLNVHLHKTEAVFPLFVKALHDKEYEHALMWAGCIVHSVGDMGALNHPDILWFSEVCLGWSGVQGPGGKSVGAAFAPDSNYNKTYFDGQYQSLYDDAMQGYQGKVLDTDPLEVLRHIYLRDHYRKVEMNTNPLVYQVFCCQEDYCRTNDPKTLGQLAASLAQFVAGTNREILDILTTGIAFAERDTLPKFDYVLAREKGRPQIQSPPLEYQFRAEDMVHFTGIWQDKPIPGAVGIVVSDIPSLVYTAGCPLGSKHQWLTSIIMHSFKADRIPYRNLSYEHLPELDPEVNPTLIIVAPQCMDNRFLQDFESAALHYINRGGHVVWLGGQVSPKLARLLPKHRFPAVHPDDRYRFPFPVLDRSKPPAAQFVCLPTGVEYPVARLQLTRLDWNTFGECRCLLFEEFACNGTTQALLRLRAAELDEIASVRVPVGEGSLVYMPWFVICPYMLSEERTMDSLVHLKLDPVGGELLNMAMRRD